MNVSNSQAPIHGDPGRGHDDVLPWDPFSEDMDAFNLHGTLIIDSYDLLNLLTPAIREAGSSEEDPPAPPVASGLMTVADTVWTEVSRVLGRGSSGTRTAESPTEPPIIPSCGIFGTLVIETFATVTTELKHNVVILEFNSHNNSLEQVQHTLSRVLASDPLAIVLRDDELACRAELFGDVEFRSKLSDIPVVIAPTLCVPSTIAQRIVYCCVTPIKLRPGDHIYRQIRSSGILRQLTHHGIYVGNGRVLHFSGNELSIEPSVHSEANANSSIPVSSSRSTALCLIKNQRAATIRSISIVDFMKYGDNLHVVEYEGDTNASTEEVIHRAEAAFAEQDFPQYDLLFNNCEHFCTWCKTGKGRSTQVTTGMIAIAGAAAAGACALLWRLGSYRMRVLKT